MKRLSTTFAAACLIAGSIAVAAQTVHINGAGATFPYPIYSKWFSKMEIAALAAIKTS